MSGLTRGKIECVINTTNRQANMQVYFKNLYDFWNAHPNATMIALQYGNSTNLVPGSSSSGTGTNYYDQATSFGFNAFFVVRLNATTVRPYDVYLLFQWCGAPNFTSNSGFGTSPGNPGNINGNTQGNAFNSNSNPGIAMQAAIGIGGTGGSAGSPNNGNPWKGTSNVNGADTKNATSVWGAPPGGGTGMMVFPRSNQDGTGAFRNTVANCMGISYFDFDTGQQRMGIVADDDSFIIFTDHSDNGNYYMCYSGIFSPRPNLVPLITYPYCAVCTINNIPLDFLGVFANGVTHGYGEIAGTQNNQGGIVNVLSGTVVTCQLDHWAGNFNVDSNFQPNHQLANLGTPYNEFPIWCGVAELYPPQQAGWLGQINFIRDVYNVPTNDTKSDFSRIFLGSTTAGSSHISAPWDSQNNTVPRSGNTRAGVTFVTGGDGL